MDAIDRTTIDAVHNYLSVRELFQRFNERVFYRQFTAFTIDEKALSETTFSFSFCGTSYRFRLEFGTTPGIARIVSATQDVWDETKFTQKHAVHIAAEHDPTFPGRAKDVFLSFDGKYGIDADEAQAFKKAAYYLLTGEK
jgi:hypothetical protein